ncbi:MAG: hypothetical protein ACJATV_000047 [Granulosicoccus sp.]
MSIFSRIDSQSLYLTQKLLKARSSKLSEAIPQQSQSRYVIGEVTIELDIPTVNKVIAELTEIGQEWLDDDENKCFKERKQIMSYLLNQWIHVGEETHNLHKGQDNEHSIH